jgi:hypothetical protein
MKQINRGTISQTSARMYIHNIFNYFICNSFRAIKSILAKDEKGDYLAPMINSSLLVMINNKYIIVLYGIMLLHSISLIRGDKTTITKAMDDFLLTHLIFFYTK